MLNVLFRANNIHNTKTNLEWRVLDYTGIKGYNLYYSEGKNNEFSLVNSELITEPNYTHIYPNYHKFTSLYYKVEVLFNDGTSQISDVLDIYDIRNQYERTMLNRDMYGLMAGVDPTSLAVAFYTRKTYDTPCPRCNNLQNNCPVCLGVGLIGGFNIPVLGYIDYLGSLSMEEVNEGNEIRQEYRVQLRTCSGYTFLKPNDYYRELSPPYRLFCIINISDSEFSTSPITYTCNCRMEESGHPLNKLKLPTSRDLVYPPMYYNTIESDYYEANLKFKQEYLKLNEVTD